MSAVTRRRFLHAAGAAAAGLAIPSDAPAQPGGKPLKFQLGLVTYNVAKDWDVPTLLKVCKSAGVDKIEAGPKGAVLSLHQSSRIDIQKLVQYISKQTGTVKLRPEDQKLVFMRPWEELPQRLKGVHKILKELTGLVV